MPPSPPPANTRDLALLVYGATGFTGKFVCEYIAKTLRSARPSPSTSSSSTSTTNALPSSSSSSSLLTWGIAGRSATKLEALARGLESQGLERPTAVLVADTADPRALDAAFGRARLVLNCTGPYRFLGEQVVTACLRAGTDYIDLCGEPEFMDRMLLKYHEEARAKNVLVISACAFDSVPADLGTLFAQRVFRESGGAALASVESFLSIDTGGHGLHGHVTTFEAAVHGFGSVKELIRVRRELKRKFPYDDARTVGPPLRAKAGPYWEPRMGKYAFRFPGSDSAVVKASQRMLILNGLVPAASALPRYAAYFTVPSAFWAAVVALVGGVFAFLAKYEWGRGLLLRHPKLFTWGAFSHEGPSDAELAATRFTMTFLAQGYSSLDPEAPPLPTHSAAAASTGGTGGKSTSSPLLAPGTKTAAAAHHKPYDKFVMTRVTGPEPGYVATPIIFVELARCLLEQRASLPPPLQGGVFTPGAVFYSEPTRLIERLRAAGVDFAVVQQG